VATGGGDPPDRGGGSNSIGVGPSLGHWMEIFLLLWIFMGWRLHKVCTLVGGTVVIVSNLIEFDLIVFYFVKISFKNERLCFIMPMNFLNIFEI
jgi:hypothetical protein